VSKHWFSFSLHVKWGDMGLPPQGALRFTATTPRYITHEPSALVELIHRITGMIIGCPVRAHVRERQKGEGYGKGGRKVYAIPRASWATHSMWSS